MQVVDIFLYLCIKIVNLMLVKTYCAAINGLEVTTVTVEVSVEAGQCLYLSGLGDEAVRESQSRIRTAYLYSGYKFPNKSITINLAPADLRKEGTSFDLPIAIGILAANEDMPKEPLDISRVCHDPARMQRIYDIGRAAGEEFVARGS